MPSLTTTNSATPLVEGGGPSSGSMVRAFLKQRDGDLRFDFLVNPSEYTLTKTNQWATSTRKGQDVSQSEFLGGLPMSMDVNFVVDASEATGERNIGRITTTLNQMAFVDPQTRDPKNHLGSPPVLEFHWGEHGVGAAFVVTKMARKVTRFDPDGTPTRVEITLSLQEWSDSNQRPRQNPTSHSPGEQRYHQVRPGQTLDLIAYQVYGDAGRWRAIAEANGLDDPLLLRPGQLLRVPEAS